MVGEGGVVGVVAQNDQPGFVGTEVLKYVLAIIAVEPFFVFVGKEDAVRLAEYVVLGLIAGPQQAYC